MIWIGKDFVLIQNDLENGKNKIKFKSFKESKITFHTIIPKSPSNCKQTETILKDIDNGIRNLDYTPLKMELKKATQSIFNYAQSLS